MALRKRGKWRYGDAQADIRTEIGRYAKEAGYPAKHFADAVCACGGRAFALYLDDTAGVASRVCVACDADPHFIGDSGEFEADSDEDECACPCGGEEFEITVGVSLYPRTEDVRWLYLGCRCPGCGLTAVYGDWKNEFPGYRDLLARVQFGAPPCSRPRGTPPGSSPPRPRPTSRGTRRPRPALRRGRGGGRRPATGPERGRLTAADCRTLFALGAADPDANLGTALMCAAVYQPHAPADVRAAAAAHPRPAVRRAAGRFRGPA